MKKFWMVMIDSNQKQHAPEVRHESLKDAAEEARRLARKNPGAGYLILEAVSRFATLDPEVVMEECR